MRPLAKSFSDIGMWSLMAAPYVIDAGVLALARHRSPDIAALLGHARTLPSALADPASVADESTRLLVEGLVIRESLLEICQEIERAMVSFEARLKALESNGGLHGRSPGL